MKPIESKADVGEALSALKGQQTQISLRCDHCSKTFDAAWSARNFVGNHVGWNCPTCYGRCGATSWRLLG